MLTLILRVALRCVAETEQVELRVARPGNLELVLALPGVRCDNEQEGLDKLPPETEGGLPQVEREAARWLVRQIGGRIEIVQGKEGAALTVRWERN